MVSTSAIIQFLDLFTEKCDSLISYCDIEYQINIPFNQFTAVKCRECHESQCHDVYSAVTFDTCFWPVQKTQKS